MWCLEVPMECMYTNFMQIVSNDFCDLCIPSCDERTVKAHSKYNGKNNKERS